MNMKWIIILFSITAFAEPYPAQQNYQPGYQVGYQSGNFYGFPAPYMAPGVYNSQYNNGGGSYGPWGSNQWNHYSSSTVVVQPPIYVPQPIPVPIGYPAPHPIMPPPPIMAPCMPRCFPPPFYGRPPCGGPIYFGVTFGF